MAFVMDSTTVQAQGVRIEHDANDDLANATPLVYSVIDNIPSMPSLFAGSLTQFYQNLNDALCKIFNQRCNIGQALQGAALESDLNELKIASSFSGQSSVGGLLPPMPTS
jgi:hypothetical protein